jgi:MFS family permease
LLAQLLGSLAGGVGLSIGLLLASDVTGSEAWATVIRASGWLSAAVFSKPLNELAVRRGRKCALLTGWILATIGTTLIVVAATSGSASAMLGGVVLTGTGSAAMLQSRFALAEVVPATQRRAAIVRLTWAGAIGSVFGPSLGVLSPLVQRVANLSPFASSYVVASMIMAGGTFVMAAFREGPGGGETGLDDPGNDQQASCGSDGGTIGLVAVGVGYAAVQFIMTASMTSTPLFLADQGVSMDAVGAAVSLHMAGMYALSPIFAILERRVGSARLMVGATICLAATLLSALWASSVGLAVARLFLVGVCWSAVQLVTTLRFAQVAVEANPESIRVQGTLDLAASLAGACGIAVAGGLMALADYSVVQGVFGAILLVWTGAIVVGLVRKAGAGAW